MKNINEDKGQLISRTGVVFDVYENGVALGMIDLDGIDEELESKKLEILALKKQIIELKRKYNEPLTKSDELSEVEFENEFELPFEIKKIADDLVEAIFKNIEK